ncbi:hypothetical protein, partial [Desulfolutivibrio sp.]|uniref:hypothetical protein n=1 Tax=Desulfolutivibrio sp. TaxID=2773296 RepID=UPI002F963C06
VWLNGDTYVGTIGPDGRTRTVVDMPRNTIATLGLAGAVPAGKLAFYIPPRAEPAFNLSAGFWCPAAARTRAARSPAAVHTAPGIARARPAHPQRHDTAQFSTVSL